MGHQIVKQPDGRLAIFSDGTNTGGWVVYDATPDEVVEWFAERAAQGARDTYRREVARVLAGDDLRLPGGKLYPFAVLNAYNKADGRDGPDGPVDEKTYAEVMAWREENYSHG